ncbi:MAG: M23 family metallopeptidase [Smithella sp.]
MQLTKPFDGNFPITQKFGDIYTDPTGHKGIDYALPVGTPVLAAADGIVERAGPDNTGYGNMVLIRHAWNDGTVYAHLRNWKVSLSQKIKSGDVIGYSGSSGNSTGAHLHFEYRLNYNDWKSAIDPAVFMQETVIGTANSVIGFSTGWAEVICADGANMRITPAGALKSWLPQGVRVHLTGKSKTAAGLPWNEIDGGFWIAQFDTENTQILANV